MTPPVVMNVIRVPTGVVIGCAGCKIDVHVEQMLDRQRVDERQLVGAVRIAVVMRSPTQRGLQLRRVDERVLAGDEPVG